MKIRFATLTLPPGWERETVLLAESLRTFGGEFASVPVSVWALEGRLPSPEITRKLSSLDAEIHTFEMDETARKFPLAVIPFGSAAAEALHADDTEVLVWLLPDTLILQPPRDIALPDEKKLAYRPVHHQNIGSSINQPPDAFWTLIYRHLEVPQERLFPMQTCFRETVRPYFNVGILAARPGDNLYRSWLADFRRTYQHLDFIPFFEQPKYAIFMHQAVLAGTILRTCDPGQLLELPESWNYPLHMHPDYPPEGKAASLDALATARYESAAELPGYLPNIPVSPDLQNWLKTHLPS